MRCELPVEINSSVLPARSLHAGHCMPVVCIPIVGPIRNSASSPTTHQPDTPKHVRHILLTHVFRYQLPQHVAEIGSHRQVAPFVKLFFLKTRLTAIDLTSTYRAAEHHHHPAMAMVRACIAALLYGAPKLRHRDQHNIFHPIPHGSRAAMAPANAASTPASALIRA